MRSSARARRRWRSSRSGSCPRTLFVANAVTRSPSGSVIRSCAPGVRSLLAGDDPHALGPPRPGGWTVDWKLYFPVDPAVAPQASRLIDTRLAPSLSTLPPTVVTDNGPVTLPVRNLMRGVALGLPSGQAVAEHLGVSPHSGTLTDPSGAALTIPDPTPLWFYCLAEAQMLGGTRLGPVAGTIVSEVLVGILLADPDSWLNQDPLWLPTLGATPGTFTMSDLITIASAG